MEKQRQSVQLTVKIIVLIAAAVISMVVMANLLSTMQTSLYQDSYTEEMEDVFDELPSLIDQANDEVQRNATTFDETYQALAQSVSYMAQNDAGFEATREKMREYMDLFDVSNVLLVRKNGRVIAQAHSSNADFTSSRFNRLRTVFDTDEPSEAVDVEVESMDWLMRYYSARIDDDTMVVIEQDPTEMRNMIELNGSTKSMLENLDIGQNGFVFAVSAIDYHVDYYPDSKLVNTDALYDGIDVAALEDGEFSWITMNGVSLYCGVRLIDDMYYITAVPVSDMTSTRNITVAVILFAFFAVMLVVIMYGIFAMRENEFRGTYASDVRKLGPLRFNVNIIQKAAILSFVGFLAVLVVSFYMQTLFALSSTSVSNSSNVDDIVENLEYTNNRMEELSEEYGERYLPMCQTIGYILDQNEDLMNRRDLQELADILNVHSILVFDSSGKLTATNSSYTDYNISTDSNDSTSEFVKVLQGVAESVVQEPQRDEVTGDIWQYIAVPLHDAEGHVDGLVQIAIRPVLLETVMETADLDTILDGVKVGSNGFAFAVNIEDNTFAYYPKNSRYVGESVLDHGMKEKELKDGYNDYLTIDGTKYYAASAETDEYYIYLAGTEGELMSERVPLTVVTGIVALICLIIVFLLMIFEPKQNIREGSEEDGGSGDRIIDTEMPSGRVVHTESAASRFMNQSFSWAEKSPWQKTETLLRWLMAVFAIIVAAAVLLRGQIFDQSSIFYYILSNKWERGLNIFAITACIMFICAAITIEAIVQRLLRLLAQVLSARGETIVRLIRSFIRYGMIIGMTYYCLLLIGIDGTTLLASAGILSVAISFGARELVEDIISGLFIICEGEFRVGDIIMVGDWRGTVLEIGIRTTKVEEPAQNVKVIRNSEVTDVINMTKKLSFVSLDFSIEYGESLERVESILAEELPKIPERLPAIENGPFYRGVTELGDNGVLIKISMQCKEGDRFQLARDFNREMKLIFDKYHINVPFPQVVLNQPVEFKEATEFEKHKAEEFNKAQKEETKGFAEDESDN